MRWRSKVLSAICGTALLGAVLAAESPARAGEPPSVPPAEVAGVAEHFGISKEEARTQLLQQDEAHRVAAGLPAALRSQLAGEWFEPRTGKLTVAVTNQAAAEAARRAGADAKLVARGQAELDRLLVKVRALASQGVPGVYGWGVDVKENVVAVNVNTADSTKDTERFLAQLGDGVRVVRTEDQPHQQGGTLHTGDPWWPGGESNCSVGFNVTEPNGAKHVLTAGHCTNDRDQAAYGQSGQQNKIGTSNVGGTHSVNAFEGDMGVVAITEPNWTQTASVNTWGQPAVTVTGQQVAMVGDRVCHSGNTSHWQCGEVKYTHKDVDYGGGLIIGDLTWTTACSLGGDSGGGWLVGDKATGLHDGGPSQCVQNPGDDDLSIFQPVAEPLQKWGLTLVTGGGGDDEPPTTPGNPRSTGVTDTTVSLAWDASVDNVAVTGYDVLNGSAVATSVTGTSATLTGLTADTAYSFTVQARDAAGNKSKATLPVAVRTEPGPGGGRTFSNGTDYPIRDFQQTYSPITVTLTGSAATTVRLSITIAHTCLEDLGISLFDPNGKAYPVKYSGSGNYPCTAWSDPKSFSVNNVASPAGGRWRLRVTDYGPGDTGTLDSWSITL